MFVRLSRSGFVPLMLLIALSSLGRAQVAGSTPAKIHLGDPAVDGSFLKPYKNAWKVVYAFPGKEPFLVGVWTDEVTAVQVEGRRLLKRAQMADYAKYNIVTTYANLFDPRTMSPVAMDFKRSDSGEWAHRDFDGATVKYRRGESADPAKTQAGQLDMHEPIFDYNGGMFGVLLAALPLKEGLKATFPALSEDRDELDWITVTVGKQELVDAGPGKQVLAWPVDTEGNYANQSHSIFWVTKEPPYVIKLVTTIPTGKWVTVTLSMI
ncbi:MAG TPA: hypothetical protein VHS34_10955 [Terriglobales bacterium]|nr:hypothetical protein [Terriglobales bacterium]